MNGRLLVIALLQLIGTAASAQQVVAPSPRPLAVLYIYGQINGPSLYYAPDVAVYDNGFVIYQVANDFRNGRHFKSVTLTNAELNAVIPPNDVSALVSVDSATPWDTIQVHPHAPLYVLNVWRGNTHRQFTVHGEPAWGPTGFADLVGRLNTFSSGRGRAWLPDSVEIELRRIDHECNPTKPVPWPASLPHPEQVHDSVHVRFRLGSKHLNRVKQLLKEHGNWDCTPVLLQGRWWGLAYDFPYPSQQLWLAR
jgi:hypothetical protein